MKSPNTAQQLLLDWLGVPWVPQERSVYGSANPHATKRGPGRYHLQRHSKLRARTEKEVRHG